MDPNLIWPHISRNYHELLTKVNANFKQQPNTLERLRSIHQQLHDITEEMEQFIGDIDAKNFELSQLEKQRLKDRDMNSSVIKRIMPVFFYTWLSESYKTTAESTDILR